MESMESVVKTEPASKESSPLMPYSVQSTSTSETDSTDTKNRSACPPICHVCGIAATGYHYDVPSCNGCKTFFRRTIVSEKKFDCKRLGKCFDKTGDDKPLKCRACRLKKCIEVGMNPLAMQLEDSEVKGEMFKEVVRKRQNSSNELPVIKVLPPTVDGKICGLIDGLIYLEIKMDCFRKSSYNPSPHESPRLFEVITDTSKIDHINSMGEMKGWPLPRDKHFQPPPPPPHLKNKPKHLKERKFWMAYDMISTVEYAKTFTFMRHLTVEDKLMLLKNVVLNCQNLNHAFFSMQKKSEYLVFPDGSSPPPPPIDAIPLANEITKNQRNMIDSLRRSDMDRQDYVLLKAICLCNAAVSGLSVHAQKVLAQEKEVYSLALFKHCMTTRGVAHGPGHYSGIIGIADLLENEQKKQKDLHLLISISKFRPHIGPNIFSDIMEAY